MTSSEIDIRISDKAGRITLQRPQALNALTYDMANRIEAALDEWQDNDGVALVIIDALGNRAFCAGGDIQDLYESGRAGDFEYGRKFWKDEYRLNAKVANFSKPYIAVMDGIVMGGGVGISAHGSHRIVTENTLFAMPECGIGLVPDVGGSLILANAPGHIGEYLGATGARLQAADTIYSGFADLFVPAEKLEDLIRTLEETGDPAAVTQYASQPEQGFLIDSQSLIDKYFGIGTCAEILDRLKQDGSEFALSQAKLMERNCPLSVACGTQIIRSLGPQSTIEDALKKEYRFTYRSMSDGDFIEGIRAQIIDKDRTPRWKLPHLKDVTQAHIDAMLAPLGNRELEL